MSDKAYEKLIKEIKRLSSKDNLIFLAVMKTNNSVDLGNIILDRQDLMINDQIANLKSGDIVLILKINYEKYVIVERVREL